MYQDNIGKTDYKSLLNEVSKLKNELAKFKKDYQDSIFHIDTENLSDTLVRSLMMQMKKEISFVDPFGNVKFKINIDTDSDLVSISVNGNQIGYVSNGSNVFYATGIWDFSSATEFITN